LRLGRAATVIVLLAMACGRRPDHRPEQLRASLTTIRGAIARYQTKHGHGPHSLRDLDLPAVPGDPITGSSRTWRLTTRETVSVDDFQSTTAPPQQSEIVDVHSGATGSDPSGRAWSDY